LRQVSGLSLRQLASKVGVSAQAISKYERGLLVPRPPVRARLAAALGVADLDAAVADPVHSPPALELLPCARFAELAHRERSAILAATGEQVGRIVTLERLLDETPVAPLPPGWPKSIRQARDIERAATELRDAWGLGSAPLFSVVGMLEHQGLRVAGVAASAGFGAACLRLGPRYLALAVNTAPLDAGRQRLSALHALSHALLRVWPDLDAEAACDHMARALLVAPVRAHAELGVRRTRLEAEELLMLSRSYCVPTHAWVERAMELDIVAGSEAARLQRSLKRRGWLTRDPGPTPEPELPSRPARLLARAKADPRINPAQLARLRSPKPTE
jgi:transcriptional regulator with XRE-family HTH domain